MVGKIGLEQIVSKKSRGLILFFSLSKQIIILVKKRN